jgi:hypothetical protein
VGDPAHGGGEDRREHPASKRADEAAGVRIHRATALQSDEVTVHHAIPVTTPTRTLLDLVSSLPRRALERALDQAEILELFDLRQLNKTIDAHRGQRGARVLAAALDEHDAGTTLTKSELEELMLAICDRHGMLGGASDLGSASAVGAAATAALRSSA